MEWRKLIQREARPVAAFGPGDEVRVWFKILEQGKERLGQFEGIVIRCRGGSDSRTFTVRRVTFGEGVERVFPLDAKTISRIELLRRGRAKRSRLYFLRTVIGKTRLASVAVSAAEKRAAAVPVIDQTAHPAASVPEASVAAAGKGAGGTPSSPT